VLHDPALAEQILLDIFVEIWRRPSRFMKITGNLSFSLEMIARNRASFEAFRLGEAVAFSYGIWRLKCGPQNTAGFGPSQSAWRRRKLPVTSSENNWDSANRCGPWAAIC
jgi:hypothetical protein